MSAKSDGLSLVMQDATKEWLGFDPSAPWLGRANRDDFCEAVLRGSVEMRLMPYCSLLFTEDWLHAMQLWRPPLFRFGEVVVKYSLKGLLPDSAELIEAGTIGLQPFLWEAAKHDLPALLKSMGGPGFFVLVKNLNPQMVFLVHVPEGASEEQMKEIREAVRVLLKHAFNGNQEALGITSETWLDAHGFTTIGIIETPGYGPSAFPQDFQEAHQLVELWRPFFTSYRRFKIALDKADPPVATERQGQRLLISTSGLVRFLQPYKEKKEASLDEKGKAAEIMGRVLEEQKRIQSEIPSEKQAGR